MSAASDEPPGRGAGAGFLGAFAAISLIDGKLRTSLNLNGSATAVARAKAAAATPKRWPRALFAASCNDGGRPQGWLRAAQAASSSVVSMASALVIARSNLVCLTDCCVRLLGPPRRAFSQRTSRRQDRRHFDRCGTSPAE